MKPATWLGLLFFGCAQLSAQDFQARIDFGALSVREADKAQIVPAGKEASRTKAIVASGKKLPVHWSLVYKGKAALSDVLVHFYVVREDRLGQTVIKAAKPADILLENAATIDFHTGEDVKAALQLAFIDPGLYMVRLEAFADGESLISTTMDVEVTQ